MLIGHLHIFEEMSVQVLCLLNGLFIFYWVIRVLYIFYIHGTTGICNLKFFLQFVFLFILPSIL